MRRGMCSCWPLPSQAETCFPLSRIHFGLDAVYQKCSLANRVRTRNVKDAEWMGSSGLTKFSDSITFRKSFRTHTLHYTVDVNLGVCWEYGVAVIISQGMWWAFCPRGHLAPGDTFDCRGQARRRLSLHAKVAAEHFPFQRRSITSPGPYSWILGASQLYFIPL